MVNPTHIWSSSQLPTLPSVAIRLLEMSKDPETEIRDVIEVIKTDPAISAKILKSTNSSFFGFSAQVTSMDRAVPLLGTTVVTSLALSFSLVEAAMTSGPIVQHYNAYWLQSVVQALSAEVLGKQAHDGLDCEFFLAGLLMDLGRLAMLKTIPNDYRPVLERAAAEQRELHALEGEVLGFDHVEIGVKLMENWSLPENLIQAVQWHHTPVQELVGRPDAPESEFVRTIAVAAAVGDYFCSDQKGTALTRLQKLTGEWYGFSAAQLEDFLGQCKQRVDEVGDIFSANAGELRDPGELMAEANEQLAQLAMRQHMEHAKVSVRQEQMEREKLVLESQNRELQQLAIRDPLTKIYNRNFFDEALQQEVHRCQRNGASLGIIFSDIDRFKQLNDTYGHQFGDDVLRGVAQVFAKVLRRSDTLARYGGEEFIVMINEPTENGLHRVAERIRQHVEAAEFVNEGVTVPVTVSVGAAMIIPRRGDVEVGTELVAAADEAMYESKRNGRNRITIRSLLSERERQLSRQVTQRQFSRWLVQHRYLDIPTVSAALLECRPARKLIGNLALAQGYVDESQIEAILEMQRETGQRFGEIAVGNGILDDEQLSQLLAVQQEDPVLLAQTLLQRGTLERSVVADALREYLSEMMWNPSPAAARATPEPALSR